MSLTEALNHCCMNVHIFVLEVRPPLQGRAYGWVISIPFRISGKGPERGGDTGTVLVSVVVKVESPGPERTLASACQPWRDAPGCFIARSTESSTPRMWRSTSLARPGLEQGACGRAAPEG